MDPLPEIVNCAGKKLVGIRQNMSLLDNQTAELWKRFMPRRNEIPGRLSELLVSLQVYGPHYFQDFDPSRKFEKWALCEVDQFVKIPAAMEPFDLSAGLYAVFHYKGLAGDPKIFRDIFYKWLPASTYLLDDRPHFEILGERYSNNDPDSEEEIWIPIKSR